MAKLTAAEIADLMPQVPGWSEISEDGMSRLNREFQFDDFKTALSFTNRIGDLAALDQRGAGLEDAPVLRIGEVFGPEKVGNRLVGAVVDEDGAQQRHFRLGVVRHGAEKMRTFYALGGFRITVCAGSGRGCCRCRRHLAKLEKMCAPRHHLKRE